MPVSSPKPSSVGRAPGNLQTLLRFGAGTVFISLTVSLLALPWCDLSWWIIFRRCVSIGAAVSLWLCLRADRRSLRSYGLPVGAGLTAGGAIGGAGKRQLRFGLLLGTGTLGAMLLLGLATGACRIDITPDRLKLWRTVLGFLPAAVLVSVLEELVFRGLILQSLLAFSKPLAVAASSALYAIVHLKTPTPTMATWLELGGLFLLGSVLAFSYFRTRQLTLAIGLHAVLAYGARVNKLILDIPDSPVSWFIGTSRLVNGLAGWLALLVMGGMVWWWTQGSQGGAQHDTA